MGFDNLLERGTSNDGSVGTMPETDRGMPAQFSGALTPSSAQPLRETDLLERGPAQSSTLQILARPLQQGSNASAARYNDIGGLEVGPPPSKDKDRDKDKEAKASLTIDSASYSEEKIKELEKHGLKPLASKVQSIQDPKNKLQDIIKITFDAKKEDTVEFFVQTNAKVQHPISLVVKDKDGNVVGVHVYKTNEAGFGRVSIKNPPTPCTVELVPGDVRQQKPADNPGGGQIVETIQFTHNARVRVRPGSEPVAGLK